MSQESCTGVEFCLKLAEEGYRLLEHLGGALGPIGKRVGAKLGQLAFTLTKPLAN